MSHGRLADAPVIEIADGAAGFAIAGTSVASFLRGWTAYYLLVTRAPAATLDTVGLPARLRHRPLDEKLFGAIVHWADPKLKDTHPDPYRRPVSAARLRTEFGT